MKLDDPWKQQTRTQWWTWPKFQPHLLNEVWKIKGSLQAIFDDNCWGAKMAIDKIWKQQTWTNAKITWTSSLNINRSYTTCLNNKNHKHKYIQITHLQHEVQRHKNIQATKDNGNFNNWQHSLQWAKTLEACSMHESLQI
jgi:hypothetical protein